MKLIAIEGCELKCSNGGTAKIETSPSAKVKIMGKGVYSGEIEISVSGSFAGGAAGNASGKGKLKLTAKKDKVEGKLVCLEGDEADVEVHGTNPSGAGTAGIDTVKIDKAGQQIVNGS